MPPLQKRVTLQQPDVLCRVTDDLWAKILSLADLEDIKAYARLELVNKRFRRMLSRPAVPTWGGLLEVQMQPRLNRFGQAQYCCTPAMVVTKRGDCSAEGGYSAPSRNFSDSWIRSRSKGFEGLRLRFDSDELRGEEGEVDVPVLALDRAWRATIPYAVRTLAAMQLSLQRLYIHGAGRAPCTVGVGSVLELALRQLTCLKSLGMYRMHMPGLAGRPFPATARLEELELSSVDMDGGMPQLKMLVGLRFLRLFYIKGLDTQASVAAFGADLSHMPHLCKLKLASCDLEHVPDSFGSLTQLTSLSFEACEMLALIPECLGKLTNLQHLDMSYTAVDSLPASLSALRHLRVLYLNLSEQALVLPSVISSLTSISILDLGCGGHSPAWKRRGAAAPLLQSLTVLRKLASLTLPAFHTPVESFGTDEEMVEEAGAFMEVQAAAERLQERAAEEGRSLSLSTQIF